METVKTAISIRKPLFDQAESLARKMKVSRSRLFVLALEDYVSHQQNRELLAQINGAYADKPDIGEKTLHRKARRVHRRMVEGEW
jgi:metal-responsive CopG/Arc/MetJ family transcriptional regulator